MCAREAYPVLPPSFLAPAYSALIGRLARARLEWPLLQDPVDQAPLLRLLGRHVEVAIDVALDLLSRPAAVADVEVHVKIALAQDLSRLDLDVGGLALDSWSPRLVDHHAGVWQREALARGAACEQDRCGAGREACAERADVRADELHRVVDGQPSACRPTGAVDVHGDVLLRILALQEEQLGHHGVGDRIGDLTAHEHDAVAQETRVDVVCALAAPGALNHGWNQHLTHITHLRNPIGRFLGAASLIARNVEKRATARRASKSRESVIRRSWTRGSASQATAFSGSPAPNSRASSKKRSHTVTSRARATARRRSVEMSLCPRSTSER